MTARDYAALFGAVIAEGEVRDRDAGHPEYPDLGHARGTGAGR